jgi:hypothetical protein
MAKKAIDAASTKRNAVAAIVVFALLAAIGAYLYQQKPAQDAARCWYEYPGSSVVFATEQSGKRSPITGEMQITALGKSACGGGECIKANVSIVRSSLDAGDFVVEYPIEEVIILSAFGQQARLRYADVRDLCDGKASRVVAQGTALEFARRGQAEVTLDGVAHPCCRIGTSSVVDGKRYDATLCIEMRCGLAVQGDAALEGEKTSMRLVSIRVNN